MLREEFYEGGKATREEGQTQTLPPEQSIGSQQRCCVFFLAEALDSSTRSTGTCLVQWLGSEDTAGEVIAILDSDAGSISQVSYLGSEAAETIAHSEP